MEEAIIRDGNLKKFNKLIRKRGIEAILDEHTFQLILSNSIYSNFDMMGTWIQEVLKAGLWDRLKPGTGQSLQAAPFRTIKLDQMKMTPKRMTKTIEAIIADHKCRRTTAIRYWLPWFILYTEKVDPKFADKLEDTVFCLLFYEALDFAFRAKASAQTFRHMFHNDRLTIQVRARYLRYCTYCITHHPAKVGKIQFMGEVVCEIAPILLAYNLNLPALATSIMTYMDDDYLAHIRSAFMEHVKEGMEDVPAYLFEAHPGFPDDDHSRDVPAYVFSLEEMPYLYTQKALITYVEAHQPDLLLVEDLLTNHLAASMNLKRETLQRVLADGHKVWAWCAAHPIEEVDAVVDLAPYLPTPIPPTIMAQVLFEVPFSDDLIDRAPLFHVHPEALGSFLFYVLDLCVRPDPERLARLFDLTLSLPTAYGKDASTKPKTWRTVTSSIQDERDPPTLPPYTFSFERAWARFFDRELLKLLRAGKVSVEVWTLLCEKGPASLMTWRPCHTSNGLGWDYWLLKTQKRPLDYLEPFWQRWPLGTFGRPERKRYTGQKRQEWNPLMWVISQTPVGCLEAGEVWDAARRYSPSFLHGDLLTNPLRLANDKKSEEACEWVRARLAECEV